MTTWCKKSLHI